MLRNKNYVRVGFVLLSCGVITGSVFAQTVATNATKQGIDVTAIIVAIINLAFPAVAAVATYLINAHVKNQQMATILSNAVQNGVGAIQRSTADAVKRNDPTITITNPDIKAGVQYVIDNAQEAISHFQIPTDRIAQKLDAKLGLANIATNLATTASPQPVIAPPLAPVT